MPSLWEGLIDWSVLVIYGADALIYGALITSGSLLFVIRLVFELFGPARHLDAAPLLRVGPLRHLTLLSFLGFLMGAGWLGLICRAELQLRLKPSAAGALGGGVVFFVVASGLASVVRRIRTRRTTGIASSESRKSGH